MLTLEILYLGYQKMVYFISGDKWTISLSKKAHGQFEKLELPIQELIDKALKALSDEGPRPCHWDVKKTGDCEYRLRLNYRYRMRYLVNEHALLIEIFYLGHRKDAYR